MMKTMKLSFIFNSFILLLLSACSKSEQNQVLTFQTRFEQQNLSCDQTVKYNDTWLELSQIQLYLSDFSIKSEQGEWQTLTMTTSPYQTSNVALLGLSCGENKTGKDNWQVTFTDNVNLATASGIRFKLGVPFELNHLNPLTQPSPLNVSSMFWGWQTGHKFMRLEMLTKQMTTVKTSEQQQQGNWLFHLGSTGCSAPSVVRAPKQACKYANVVDVELALVQQSNNKQTIVTIDLSRLLSGISLTAEQSCQSARSDKSCQQLFQRLGLIDNSGAGQQLFKVKNEK